MAERINLTAPRQVAPPATKLEVIAIHKRRDPWQLHVELRDENGRVLDFNYAGDVARTVIIAGNSANNSTKSEQQRLLEWMQQRGDIGAGTFEVIPDAPVGGEA